MKVYNYVLDSVSCCRDKNCPYKNTLELKGKDVGLNRLYFTVLFVWWQLSVAAALIRAALGPVILIQVCIDRLI